VVLGGARREEEAAQQQPGCSGARARLSLRTVRATIVQPPLTLIQLDSQVYQGRRPWLTRFLRPGHLQLCYHATVDIGTVTVRATFPMVGITEENLP
jgi:hypothetical protein